MNYLYLDSSNGLTIGLLNQELDWISYESLDEKKPSEVIHVKINELLEKNKIDLKQFKIISSAGPGSYTGMRLSEGISHILKVCGIETISFFQFEVPKFSGIKSGVWITNAFKGEHFVYEWEGENENKFLEVVDKLKKYSEIYSNLNEINGQKTTLTNSLVYSHQKEIFKKVIERNRFFEAYYYRTLDEEFKQL